MNFFFFYKRISDLDHLSPIIFSLIKNQINPNNIKILNLQPDKTLLDLDKDLRVIFLRSLGLDFDINRFKRRYLRAIEKIINPSKFNIPVKVIRRIFYLKVVQNLLDKIFIQDLLRKLEEFSYLKTDLFILDHSTSQAHLEIIKLARKKKLKIVSVPHGLITHEGLLDLEHNEMLFKENTLMNEYDAVVFSNLEEANRSKIDEKKKLVLGSARFSREWHEKLNTIYDNVNVKKRNKINILLLAEKDGRQIGNHFVPDIYPEKIKEVISLLSSENSINLIIKHHPSRTGRFGADDFGPYVSEKAKHIFKDQQGSTFQLIKECDLILTTFSSAVIDAFLSKKRVLVLEFASPYKLVYKKFSDIECLGNIEDLTRVLSKPNGRTFDNSSSAYDRFIKEYVEKNPPNLDNYYQFLTSISTKQM